MRYYASGVVKRISDAPEDGVYRETLLGAIRERVQHNIDRDGAFRDPQDYRFFVADLA